LCFTPLHEHKLLDVLSSGVVNLTIQIAFKPFKSFVPTSLKIHKHIYFYARFTRFYLCPTRNLPLNLQASDKYSGGCVDLKLLVFLSKLRRGFGQPRYIKASSKE
jgi:hypothetical protein